MAKPGEASQALVSCLLFLKNPNLSSPWVDVNRPRRLYTQNLESSELAITNKRGSTA